jgi:hypothetical protein
MTVIACDVEGNVALVIAVMNCRFLSNAGKLSSGYTTGEFPSTTRFHGISYQKIL